MSVTSRLSWIAGLLLAAVAGVAFALWRAPDTVVIPIGTSPGTLPAPMPAPPMLALDPACPAEPEPAIIPL